MAIVIAGSTRLSAGPPDELGFQMSIPTDKALAGWTLLGGEVTADGDLLNLEPGTTLVRSEHTYRDFVLEFQYMGFQENGQSSGGFGPLVYLRSAMDEQRTSLSGSCIQLSQPAVYRRARRGRLARRRAATVCYDRWNQLRLEVVGDQASVYINDQLSDRLTQLPRASGLIALGVTARNPASVMIRDVQITELDHRPLFNGHDLEGWQGAGADAKQCWEVHEGRLRCTGQKGPWLRSNETFADFNLRLEYLLLEGGNSGVYVRVPQDGQHHGQDAGVEIQILDDNSPRYTKLKPYQFSGSVYAIAPATQRVSRPAGVWNSLEINCIGTRYTVIHNGITIVDVTDQEFPELAKRLSKGYLGLQNHSESVAFRSIRIGPPQIASHEDTKTRRYAGSKRQE